MAPASSESGSRSTALREQPLTESFWPTRICTRGPGILDIQRTCACDEALVCTVQGHEAALDLRIRTKPHACKDCPVMVFARCPLPPGLWPKTAKTFSVTINGSPVLDHLEIRPGGHVSIESCAD